MKTAFLGRFQPFHNGHKKVIENFCGEELCVVVGSAGKSGTEENPLTAEQREQLIRECFPDIEIVYLEDYETDREWSKKLVEKTGAGKLLSGNKNVREAVSNIKVEQPEMFEPEIYSGSEVRRRIKSGEEWRYLVPECSKERLEDLIDIIKDSGINYEFEPGWKRENARN